jgi:ribonuclease HI
MAKREYPHFAPAITGTGKRKPNLPLVKLWTDGGCHSGHGGWAFIMEYNGRQVMLSGSRGTCTANEMELTAFIEALNRLKVECRVELVSDSTYLVNGLTIWMNNWRIRGFKRQEKTKRARKSNPGYHDIPHHALWKAIYALCEKHHVFAKWVKAHKLTTPRQNKMCDRMARMAWVGLKNATLTPIRQPAEPDTEVIAVKSV